MGLLKLIRKDRECDRKLKEIQEAVAKPPEPVIREPVRLLYECKITGVLSKRVSGYFVKNQEYYRTYDDLKILHDIGDLISEFVFVPDPSRISIEKTSDKYNVLLDGEKVGSLSQSASSDVFLLQQNRVFVEIRANFYKGGVKAIVPREWFGDDDPADLSEDELKWVDYSYADRPRGLLTIVYTKKE